MYWYEVPVEPFNKSLDFGQSTSNFDWIKVGSTYGYSNSLVIG